MMKLINTTGNSSFASYIAYCAFAVASGVYAKVSAYGANRQAGSYRECGISPMKNWDSGDLPQRMITESPVIRMKPDASEY